MFVQILNLGGLDLSRRGLDRDSRSRRRQRVSLDSRENLDSVKKLVSTIEISRSRLLDFVSTTMSRPKSLDRDREIRRDLKFRRFSTVCLDLDREVRGFLYFLVEISQSVETLGLDNVKISRQISTASRQSRQKSRRVTVSTEKSRF